MIAVSMKKIQPNFKKYVWLPFALYDHIVSHRGAMMKQQFKLAVSYLSFQFNVHHKVKSTGFQPVSFSRAYSWPGLCRSHQRGRKSLPSAGSEAGGLPVPCDPREPTYFSRWLFSFSTVKECRYVSGWVYSEIERKLINENLKINLQPKTYKEYMEQRIRLANRNEY